MPAGERALVFGDLIDDVIVVPQGPIQPDTDTPSSIRSRPGGSAANSASWMAAEGADVVFVGRCARGDTARHAEALERLGVLARIQPDDDLPTGAIIVVVQGDERTMLTQRGANAALSPDDIDPAGFALVHATGYSILGHEDSFAALVARAHEAGARVSLNAGAVAAIDEIGPDRFREVIAGVDILLCTEAEAHSLTGHADPSEAAVALAARHGAAAVTVGRHGAWVADAAGASLVDAERVDAVDPTGAGDAFTGGFLAAVLRGQSVIAAGRSGVRTAARAVSSVGARPR